MSAELAAAIAELRRARDAHGTQLHRIPEVVHAIDRVLRIAKASSR